MSTQHALDFLQALRRNPALRARLEEGQETLKSEDLVAWGGGLGLAFTVDELNQAFRHDWIIRALVKA